MPKFATSSVSPVNEARRSGTATSHYMPKFGAHLSHLENLLALPGLEYLTLETDSVLQKVDCAGALFAIVSAGVVGVQEVLPDGRRSISHLFLPGDIIDFRYFDRTPGSAVCLFPCELVLVSTGSIAAMGDDEPEVRRMLGRNLMKHWGFATRHCTDLARKSAVEKLATYIFECRNRSPVKSAGVGGNSVHLALRRIDISDYLGLRPETLCRAFAKLKQGKLIAFNDINYVDILREDDLRKIADGCSVDKLSGARQVAS